GEDEELVGEPFERLIAEKQLIAYSYDGFWQSMDTFKDRQLLENFYASGRAPWQLWGANGNGRAVSAGGREGEQPTWHGFLRGLQPEFDYCRNVCSRYLFPSARGTTTVGAY